MSATERPHAQPRIALTVAGSMPEAVVANGAISGIGPIVSVTGNSAGIRGAGNSAGARNAATGTSIDPTIAPTHTQRTGFS